MSEATPAARPLPWRGIGLAALAWIAVVAIVLVGASAMTKDPQPAERVSTPDPNLPPITLTLDHDLPEAAATAPSAAKQIEILQNLATTDNTPQSWVDLGAARHYQGDYAGAVLDYRRALTLDANRLDAQVGLLMVDAATESGRVRSAAALATLAASHPESQLVSFNQGMVAIYRRDSVTAQAALRHVLALNPKSTLGKVAARLTGAAAGNTTPTK